MKIAQISASLLAATLCTTPFSNAASIASDSAADAAYDDGWQSGDNGGSGWGSGWTLTSSSPGGVFSVGNSAGNGNGDSSAPTGDINTPQSGSGRAWALAANTGSTADAFRAFNGSLAVGQTFMIDFDSGTLESGAEAGFRLQNSGGETLWAFRYIGGFSLYNISDSSSAVGKSAGFTDEGIRVEFTLTSATTYSAIVTPLGSSSSSTRNGSLIPATGGAAISQFNLYFTGNANSSTVNQQFFNNAVVVPEPSAFGLLVMSITLFGMKRRRTMQWTQRLPAVISAASRYAPGTRAAIGQS